MTILTKPNSGAKLCPKGPNPTNVENGAIIEQVRVFFLFSSLSLCFCRIPYCQRNCIAIQYQVAYENFSIAGPITNESICSSFFWTIFWCRDNRFVNEILQMFSWQISIEGVSVITYDSHGCYAVDIIWYVLFVRTQFGNTFSVQLSFNWIIYYPKYLLS